ncbi:MAG: nuclear transport factor 2 family protein [Pseudomonadota bacterium]
MNDIADHYAIERLMLRYARCADRKDFDGFGEVFTADAVFVNGGEEVVSLPSIQAMMRALEDFPITLHQVSNVLYDITGDTAEGETYCRASHISPGSDTRSLLEMGIVYRDKLRRIDLGWRIARREFEVLWSQIVDVEVSAP